jgi:hypothetical protein
VDAGRRRDVAAGRPGIQAGQQLHAVADARVGGEEPLPAQPAGLLPHRLGHPAEAALEGEEGVGPVRLVGEEAGEVEVETQEATPAASPMFASGWRSHHSRTLVGIGGGVVDAVAALGLGDERDLVAGLQREDGPAHAGVG